MGLATVFADGRELVPPPLHIYSSGRATLSTVQSVNGLIIIRETKYKRMAFKISFRLAEMSLYVIAHGS
jgi:hypothetical protein